MLAFLSSWDASHWQAAGNMLLGVGAVVGGLFGLHTYRKSTRTREAEWLDRLFERFYLNDRFSPVLLSFEYEMAAGTAALVDRVLTMHDPVLEPAQIERIRSVDVVLNFLEHLLYLASDRHLLERDRDAMFGYWLGLLSQPRYASLRQYALQFGYEHVARHCGASAVRHVFVYGTLMRGQDAHARLRLEKRLQFVCDAVVPARLYRLPDYPGLRLEPGAAHGELFRIEDPTVLADMDAYEEYNPADLAASEYARRLVHVPGAAVDAWVYAYLPATGDAPVIEGRWGTPG